jgi:hypothetical protein
VFGGVRGGGGGGPVGSPRRVGRRGTNGRAEKTREGGARETTRTRDESREGAETRDEALKIGERGGDESTRYAASERRTRTARKNGIYKETILFGVD